jgi:hypothetical protein
MWKDIFGYRQQEVVDELVEKFVRDIGANFHVTNSDVLINCNKIHGKYPDLWVIPCNSVVPPPRERFRPTPRIALVRGGSVAQGKMLPHRAEIHIGRHIYSCTFEYTLYTQRVW